MKCKGVTLILFISILLTACNYPGPTTNISCDVNELIKAIVQANQLPDIDTFNLAPGCSYELKEVYIVKDGNNGLPIIESPIVINGHGATIARSGSSNQPTFRLFQVVASGNLTLNDITLQNGYASNDGSSYLSGSGGAILNFGLTTINNSLITKNSAYTAGAIYNSKGSMEIVRSTVSFNQAESLRDGILNAAEGTMVISHSTVSENGITNGTTAIWNVGEMEIANSTVSSNGGIGIDNDQDAVGPGLLSLDFVTIANNGGGINSSSGTVTLNNTLIGPHPSPSCSNSSNINSQNANIDTDGTCNAITVPPNGIQLGPLLDNGGPTKTHALGASSMAIDAALGDCPVNDQRGVHRPQGVACDIGAYEYDGEMPHPTSTATIINEIRTEETLTPTETATQTLTMTMTPTEEDCIYTALVNLFCRLGPSSSMYPEVDSFTPGQSGQVYGFSPDGFFAQVEGANNKVACYVPLGERFGELSGNCDGLPILIPPPTATFTMTPSPEPEEEEVQPIQGCEVRQPGGAIKCVSPCPAGAAPGAVCTMP